MHNFSKKNNCDDSFLDINHLLTTGREGILSFVVTGDSVIEEIKPGSLVFVDSLSIPQDGNVTGYFLST